MDDDAGAERLLATEIVRAELLALADEEDATEDEPDARTRETPREPGGRGGDARIAYACVPEWARAECASETDTEEAVCGIYSARLSAKLFESTLLASTNWAISDSVEMA